MIWLTQLGGISTTIFKALEYFVSVFSIRIFSTDILGNIFLVKRLSKKDVKDNSDDGKDGIRFVTKEEKKDYQILKDDLKDN